ncbi:hypothetical protein KM043_017044 [Ampulex compressa]|nr:hypothetical protein KM043_017044 [Ampulex compressa]
MERRKRSREENLLQITFKRLQALEEKVEKRNEAKKEPRPSQELSEKEESIILTDARVDKAEFFLVRTTLHSRAKRATVNPSQQPIL